MGDATVGALEVIELVVAVDRDPCSSRRSWKNRPACSPNVRLSGRASSITIVHELPSTVSEAATSLRDVGAADQDDALAGGVLADRVAVPERSQVVDALELASGHVQTADVRAGREQCLDRS